MGRHEFLVLGLHYLVATVLLFFSLAVGTLTYGGIALPCLLLVLSLLVIFRIAWITRRPATPELKGRSLWVTLPLSFGGVFIIALFLLLVLYRRYWFG